MGGQFQADGEEQFHYNSLRSIFKPTKIKLKPLPTHSVPATPETILDEPASHQHLKLCILHPLLQDNCSLPIHLSHH